MPKRKGAKSDVDQIKGILEEFGRDDIAQAIAEMNISPLGTSALIAAPGFVSLQLSETVLDLLPLLLAVKDSTSWSVFNQVNATTWTIKLSFKHADCANLPYTVTQTVGCAAAVTVATGTATAVGAAGMTFPATKGALLTLKCGATVISAWLAPTK